MAGDWFSFFPEVPSCSRHQEPRFALGPITEHLSNGPLKGVQATAPWWLNAPWVAAALRCPRFSETRAGGRVASGHALLAGKTRYFWGPTMGMYLPSVTFLDQQLNLIKNAFMLNVYHLHRGVWASPYSS